MIRSPFTLGLCCVLLALPARAAAPPDYKKDVAPLVSRYCFRCHGGKKARGGVALDRFPDEAAVRKDPNLWERVADNLRAGDMPPPNRHPRPTAGEVQTILGYLDAVVLKSDCTGPKDPGRATLPRLNRAEYNNTIRDLVGIRFRPANDFPADDVGYGFDNIGDVLSMPPILMEKYLDAAEKVIDLAFQSPQARQRILVEKGETAAAARKILKAFATRAFRRPVRDDEVDRLMRLMESARKNGDGYQAALKLALQAVLVSPHFLFHVERDRRPSNPKFVHPVGQYELASRLSYFLWSSMPDEELLRMAAEGRLHRPEVLEAQAKRMLKDPRSRALVDNFAGQWLQLRNLKSFNPNPDQFPGFNESLRSAMLKETELFFEHVMREDRSILDFIDADYTFLNDRLARHYEIPGIEGEQFRKVTLTGVHRQRRGGLLTQASILAATSNPTRTSPVKRGKWILENMLGTTIPPPPNGVEELKEGKEVVLSGTLRQRMEQHRADPSCASCHQRMDPLGFGFENFDAVGGWRDKEGKFAIDSSGVLPGGQSFKGPAELRAILKKKDEAFARCLADKLLTYALGRGTERSDRCYTDEIVRRLARDKYKFSSLVVGIVQSEPFLKRRGYRGTKK